MNKNEHGKLTQLYNELNSFRNHTRFHVMGLGKGGPYHKWLNKVKKHLSSENISGECRIVAKYIQALGIEYVMNNGESTALTRRMSGEIEGRLSA